MNRAPQLGERPWRTPGWAITSRAPSTPITVNHTRITGPNSHPTAPVPLRWIANSPARIAERDRDDQVREPGRRDLQPFDRRRDRDRRRDHAVAEEQPAPKIPSTTSSTPAADPPALDQRRERHHAAVAAVVRAHDHARVLERDDDHQRPEDQRDDPVDAGDRSVRRVPVRVEDHLLGVERARPDVAVHDPERAKREHDLAGMGDDVALILVADAAALPCFGAGCGHRPGP